MMKAFPIPLFFLLAFALLGGASGAVQPWTSKDGLTVKAELMAYDWDAQQLSLLKEGETGPMKVFVEQLDLPSKIRLLISPVYREAFAERKPELAAHPHYQTRFSELRTMLLVLSITYVVTWFSVSWVLASWITLEGNVFALLKVILLYGVITASLGFLLFQFGSRLDPLGDHRTYILAGLGIYVLFFVILAMWGFRTSLIRAFSWYVISSVAVIILPLTLIFTGFASQVYKAEGTLNMETAEKYLMETWFEPMGLL